MEKPSESDLLKLANHFFTAWKAAEFSSSCIAKDVLSLLRSYKDLQVEVEVLRSDLLEAQYEMNHERYRNEERD